MNVRELKTSEPYAWERDGLQTELGVEAMLMDRQRSASAWHQTGNDVASLPGVKPYSSRKIQDDYSTLFSLANKVAL